MECGFPEKGMNVDLTEHTTGCMLGVKLEFGVEEDLRIIAV